MAGYLVTGGCGFIGSHLVDALERGGHRVTVLDDFSTGKRHNISSGPEIITGSVTDARLVESAVRGVDGVFHLAAIASVERSREAWSATHTTNLTGFINILEAVARCRTSIPVVYASSAAVYGNAERAPIEETAKLKPLTAYGADKLGCELHAHVAAVVHGIPTTGLRFFNIYGPRQDPASPYSGVISVFCDRLRRQRRIDIYGDGQQVRDFVYVSDAVAALMQAMATTVAEARVFNVCTGVSTRISDLARIVAELCVTPPAIDYRPARAGDIRISIGSPAGAESRLGFRAQTGLREGLSHTLRWMAQESAISAAARAGAYGAEALSSGADGAGKIPTGAKRG
jgi:UDP-glucose 4-epimerase